jgi:ABC-type nitrate/sulfonate/bicarbonate transport system ATPase subunit
MGQSGQVTRGMETCPNAQWDRGLIAPPVAAGSSLSKRFGATQALSDVSIEVQPGEAHALVGRNGAGKSTLVSIMTGLTAPGHRQANLFGRAGTVVTGARSVAIARCLRLPASENCSRAVIDREPLSQPNRKVQNSDLVEKVAIRGNRDVPLLGPAHRS